MVDMQLPQWLARFNRHVTNPIQRLWAGWAPTFGILEHVGRNLAGNTELVTRGVRTVRISPTGAEGDLDPPMNWLCSGVVNGKWPSELRD
jgi:hypothetical protein